MKARSHFVVGAILGVLCWWLSGLPIDQFGPMVGFVALASVLIDVDHFVAYMYLDLNRGLGQLYTLNLSDLLHGMTHDLPGYFVWHTAVILGGFFLAAFLPMEYRVPGYILLIVHWVMDFVVKDYLMESEVGVTWA